jgi:type IV secretion system protein TrbG
VTRDHSLTAIAMLLLLCSGTSVAAQQLSDPPERPESMDSFLQQLLAAEQPAEPASLEPSALPAPPTPEDRERQAYETYVETGRAPILATPSSRVHPFGRTYPTLVCIPDRACDIRLEEGEVISGIALGDAERWQTEFLTEGNTPHILVRPLEDDLRTNLVVLTNRRTYHLELRAPTPEELEERTAVVYEHLAWWYPDRWVRRLEQEALQRAAEAAAPPSSLLDQPLTPGQINPGYVLEHPRKRRNRLGWEPTTVFDDGHRVYLHLPAAARAGELPVLIGRLPGGETYPLNTQVHGDWLVVPTLFEAAELVIGTGDTRRYLRIHSGRPAR